MAAREVAQPRLQDPRRALPAQDSRNCHTPASSPREGKGNRSCHSQRTSVTVAGTAPCPARAAPSTGTGMAPAGTRRFTPPCAPVFMVSPYSALCSSQLIKVILPRTVTALMLFLPFPSLRVAYQKLRSDLKISKKRWKLLRLMEPKHRNHGTI